MCDLGLVLGLASGALNAAAQADAAKKNQKMVIEQARLKNASEERKLLVETDAANKEAYKASLEKERGESAAKVTSTGIQGSTAGARVAEQSRQGALSISNARDRAKASTANYAMAGKFNQIEAQNRVNTLQPSPLAMFANIASSGISNYGAFG